MTLHAPHSTHAAVWLALQAVVLTFAAYRILRLISWDEWPPARRARAWLIGEYWVPSDPPAGAEKAEGTGRVDAGNLGLPGKQPASPVAELRPAYRRPTLAHLVHCPYCAGWWVSLAVYVAWLLEPSWTMYVATPFALSGAIGLIARNLDP